MIYLLNMISVFFKVFDEAQKISFLQNIGYLVAFTKGSSEKKFKRHLLKIVNGNHDLKMELIRSYRKKKNELGGWSLKLRSAFKGLFKVLFNGLILILLVVIFVSLIIIFSR
jgi:hypothetical protein